MIKLLFTLKRRAGMSQQAFEDYRRDVHVPLLLAIPEAQYMRRFVVSYPIPAPGFGEPSYDAVVETWFDSLDDLKALFFSENFQTKVEPDHSNFLDMTQGGILVSEELVLIEG
ncbi:EthD domain-containing protein [Larkinella knui]|uniref:EthD family reductase n=1 Tax=Larkinella knui TaxID=2025310 RepID=A0A3P1CK22_9BACT|nr:EthD domain-containing protein [Larkinella knui]RRB13578.1 EthD family reductase [Larkinella knui]